MSLATINVLNKLAVFNNIHKSALLQKCVLTSKMTSHNLIQDHFQPPEHVRFMTKLDRTKFTKEINIPCLIVTKLKVNAATKNVKKYLFKVERMKPVISNSVFTTILLNPQLISKFEDFDPIDRDHFASIDITSNNFDHKIVTLTYDNFKVEDILRAVLPNNQEGLSSFTKVGHITHVNLREHLFPYKSLIGQVLLDKVHGCRSVVNKAAIIDNTYRNFHIELLCGEENFKTEVRENTCRFEFDFSKVYWNSRLSTEHERIVNKIKKGDVLFDVFAGVGPFSIPASKKGCIVYANDLNPFAYDYLNKNIHINLTENEFIETYNLDGRIFIQNQIKEKIINHIGSNVTIHIVMNLPALSCDFLIFFVRLFEDFELEGMTKFPILYVYTFCKGEDCNGITKQQIANAFGWDMTAKIMDFYKVRTVSTNKEMVRVTIRLDKDILTGRKEEVAPDVKVDVLGHLTASALLAAPPGDIQLSNDSAQHQQLIQLQLVDVQQGVDVQQQFCVGVKRALDAEHLDDSTDFSDLQPLKKFDLDHMGKKSNNRGKRAPGGNKKTSKKGSTGVGGKPKAKKAQAVKKTLKNIQIQNRAKVDSVDKDLVQIQADVRKVAPGAGAKGKALRRGKARKAAHKAAHSKETDFKELEKKKEDSLKKLDNMDIGVE